MLRRMASTSRNFTAGRARSYSHDETYNRFQSRAETDRRSKAQLAAEKTIWAPWATEVSRRHSQAGRECEVARDPRRQRWPTLAVAESSDRQESKRQTSKGLIHETFTRREPISAVRGMRQRYSARQHAGIRCLSLHRRVSRTSEKSLLERGQAFSGAHSR